MDPVDRSCYASKELYSGRQSGRGSNKDNSCGILAKMLKVAGVAFVAYLASGSVATASAVPFKHNSSALQPSNDPLSIARTTIPAVIHSLNATHAFSKEQNGLISCEVKSAVNTAKISLHMVGGSDEKGTFSDLKTTGEVAETTWQDSFLKRLVGMTPKQSPENMCEEIDHPCAGPLTDAQKLPRAGMPQFTSAVLKKFQENLKEMGYHIEEKYVPTDTLRPMQLEIGNSIVERNLHRESASRPIFVVEVLVNGKIEHMILDGHHGAFITKKQNKRSGKNLQQNAILVSKRDKDGLPTLTPLHALALLKASKNFPGVTSGLTTSSKSPQRLAFENQQKIGPLLNKLYGDFVDEIVNNLGKWRKESSWHNQELKAILDKYQHGADILSEQYIPTANAKEIIADLKRACALMNHGLHHTNLQVLAAEEMINQIENQATS